MNEFKEEYLGLYTILMIRKEYCLLFYKNLNLEIFSVL